MGCSEEWQEITLVIKIFSRLFQKNMMDMKHSVIKNLFMHSLTDILADNMSFWRVFVLPNINIVQEIKQLDFFHTGWTISGNIFFMRYCEHNTMQNFFGGPLARSIQPYVKNSS